MAKILIVDDSAVDRQLVGGLPKQESDFEVTFACNGKEALEVMESQTPNLVVTDIIMPEMNGLELVKAIKSAYPLVPVILMTSKGNEEVAVNALKSGAASYTPKNTLAQSLVETVRSVLDVSTQEKSHARLLQCMTESVSTFLIDNDYTLIAPLVGLLQENSVRIGLCDEADRIRVGVALDEALVNALYHGNLELSSKLRDTDHEKYIRLVQQRRFEQPYCDRHIHVQAKLSPQKAEFVIRDEGPGFDPETLPDPRDPANLQDLGGRGVLLMRTFMDEIRYNDTGNEVTMIKLHPSSTNKSNGES